MTYSPYSSIFIDLHRGLMKLRSRVLDFHLTLIKSFGLPLYTSHKAFKQMRHVGVNQAPVNHLALQLAFGRAGPGCNLRLVRSLALAAS